MSPTRKSKIKKITLSISILLLVGMIFTFFALKEISVTSAHRNDTNKQTLQFAFERVGFAYYTSAFNIAKTKEFPEFQQYIRESQGKTDYYNINLLCRKMNSELFKELDRKVVLSFYCVGTNRVVSVSSTQESEYYFQALGTSPQQIEEIKGTEYFLIGKKIVQVKRDSSFGQDVFWITSFSVSELFNDALRSDLYWEFFDRNNNLIYSHISEDATLETAPSQTYVDHYSANYFHYYAPDVFNLRPLLFAALYTFFTSFFLIVMQITVSARRFKTITKELDIPNRDVAADDIVTVIRKIKDKSQVFEENFEEAKKINAEDSLKDFFSGVKTYIELEPEIVNELENADLLLVCVTSSPTSNVSKAHWSGLRSYAKGKLGLRLFVMSPEKMLVLFTKEEEKLLLADLKAYTPKPSQNNIADFAFLSYEKTNILQEMEGASFDFDIETSSPHATDKNDDTKDKMLGFIHNNYERDISLTDLAEHMLETEKYVSTLFKYETGTNFKEYLTRYRMIKAEKLLLEQEDIKIKTIAAKVGYNSSNSFIRVFRNFFGVSPLNYKKNSEDPPR